MIDLHCHLLPGIDDGSRSLAESLEMARMMVAEGVGIVACTPHIMPGVYDNVGKDIRARVVELQNALDDAGINLSLVTGADVHVAPNLLQRIQAGAVLTLHDTRYILIEPPHHVAPPRLEEFFFSLIAAGLHPILTHPERLTWIEPNFEMVRRLSHAGVWMQITTGSLLGQFGKKPQYWALRMMDDGLCHILATDAHGTKRRPPNLRAGFDLAATRVGYDEAVEMILHRPYGILENRLSSTMTRPRVVIPRESEAHSEGLWRRITGMIGGEHSTARPRE